MSKEVEWGDIHGEGEIVCNCDECGNYHCIEFYGSPDYRQAQREIKTIGWVSGRINGEWLDFCSTECRNAYVRKNF
jgi:hypothetical protein